MALRERDQLAASLALCIPPGFPLLQKKLSPQESVMLQARPKNVKSVIQLKKINKQKLNS